LYFNSQYLILILGNKWTFWCKGDQQMEAILKTFYPRTFFKSIENRKNSNPRKWIRCIFCLTFFNARKLLLLKHPKILQARSGWNFFPSNLVNPKILNLNIRQNHNSISFAQGLSLSIKKLGKLNPRKWIRLTICFMLKKNFLGLIGCCLI